MLDISRSFRSHKAELRHRSEQVRDQVVYAPSGGGEQQQPLIYHTLTKPQVAQLMTQQQHQQL